MKLSEIAAILLALIGLTALVMLLTTQDAPAPREAPVIIRLDLTPEAMAACKRAFVRYGFSDVDEYECRLEREGATLQVALYGPDYNDPTYKAKGGEAPVRRLGSVSLGGGK